MKIKILVGVLVFLIIVNFATIGSYTYFHITKGGERNYERPLLKEEFRRTQSRPPRLRLNSDQRRQLWKLNKQFQADIKEYEMEIDQIRTQIFQELEKESFSMDKVEEKLQNIAQIKLNIEKHAIMKLRETKKYLSPAQRQLIYDSMLDAPGKGLRKDRIRHHGEKRKNP
jgi:hypothetical protein